MCYYLNVHFQGRRVKYYGALALSQSLHIKHVNCFQITRTHTQALTIRVICTSDEGSHSTNHISYAGRFKVGISETQTLQTLDVIGHTRCSAVSSGSVRTSQRIQAVSVTEINHAQRSHTHTHKYVFTHRQMSVSVAFQPNLKCVDKSLAKVPNPDTCGRTGRNAAANIRFLNITDTPKTKLSRCSTG